jgi:two-component system sensor histidine kinase/response regulator
MALILIIDDEVAIRSSLRELLRLEEHDVIEAANGDEGLALLYEHTPDMIICDIMMPQKDGYEVLQLVRQSDVPFSTIPFLFLTAKKNSLDQRRGMNLGADDYLTKPFDVEELYSSINAVFGKRKQYIREINARLRKLQHSGISASSHEYLTPLTSILGGTEFLYTFGEMMDVEQRQDILHSVIQAGKRLERSIENFLLFQKIQTNAVRYEGYERYYLLQHSITEAVNAVLTRFRGREADIIVQVDTFTPQMDYEYVKKVLIEVIDNALKFSTEGQQILIEGEYTPNTYTLRIHDRGQGFQEKYIPEIDAFRQFDRDVFEQQGIGLGLYIVRELLCLYGASMAIDTAVGHGTTVTIIFPIHP